MFSGILGSITSIFKGLGAVFGFFKDRQLINAGKATQRSENQEEVLKDVQDANTAKSDLRDPDERERVRSKFHRRDQ